MQLMEWEKGLWRELQAAGAIKGEMRETERGSFNSGEGVENTQGVEKI